MTSMTSPARPFRSSSFLLRTLPQGRFLPTFGFCAVLLFATLHRISYQIFCSPSTVPANCISSKSGPLQAATRLCSLLPRFATPPVMLVPASCRSPLALLETRESLGWLCIRPLLLMWRARPRAKSATEFSSGSRLRLGVPLSWGDARPSRRCLSHPPTLGGASLAKAQNKRIVRSARREQLGALA